MAKKQDKAPEAPAAAPPPVEGGDEVAGVEGAPPAEAPAATPPPVVEGAQPAPPAKRFRVWPHGSLHVSGAVFGPGEELPLSEAEVEQLGVGSVVVAF